MRRRQGGAESASDQKPISLPYPNARFYDGTTWAELLAMPLPDLCQHIRCNIRSMFDATAEDTPEERDRQLAFLRDVSSQLDVIETRVAALIQEDEPWKLATSFEEG